MTLALDTFRALADASRLRIVALVRAMELSVGELAQVLEQSQPRVSRHVKILADAGLVARRREGSWVFVALGATERSAPVLALMDATGAGDGAAEDMARLAEVRADRALAAQQWFEGHAGEWDALRSLHVAEAEVEAAMATALGQGDERAAPLGRMIDIGTGTGRMIELFAPAATSVLGIDRSPEMLRLARAKLGASNDGRGIANAELRQGDLYALPLADAGADLAILHHVLHYAQAPDAAIAEAARVLSPGGRLLLADFAPHDREELRQRDAHVRLGFSDAQIAAWYAAAGLMMVQVDTLKGGELTVKLWLGRKTAQGAAGDAAPAKVKTA